jgi:hypothetical protein
MDAKVISMLGKAPFESVRSLAPSDFFFSVGGKPSLNGENIMAKMNDMKS